VATIDRIRTAMRDFEPEVVEPESPGRAAVAIVASERDGRAEILFIERATREGDPWSGHMAFPGGRMDEPDPSTRAAAERETFEEVGISLDGAEHLGLLGELQGSNRFRQSQLVVSAHVYHLPEPGPVVLERSEVREAIWFPVEELLCASRHVEYASPRVQEYTFPGILVGEPGRHVVWGLTYRFVDIFMSMIELPLPDRWGDIRKEELRR
jgi:8-oxo-dGTP pyrophosphatase MutT (NUDIX family)